MQLAGLDAPLPEFILSAADSARLDASEYLNSDRSCGLSQRVTHAVTLRATLGAPAGRDEEMTRASARLGSRGGGFRATDFRVTTRS